MRDSSALAGVMLAVVVLWSGAAETTAAPALPEWPRGVVPVAADGRPLNLDFETGTLADWTPSGEAYAGQPVRGDTVRSRRADMRSQHRGEYWIGSFERQGDAPRGTLTSAVFQVTHPYASFLMGGGSHASTCVELVREDTGAVFYRISGDNSENLQAVVVDLAPVRGKRMFVRLVDSHTGGWGHVNFDEFRFHDSRPTFPAEAARPPVDVFAHAGVDPVAAARAMTVPEGFSVTLFAGEPDVVQPIAMAFDDRGRLWVAEAYSYPRRVAEEDARDRILIFDDQDGDGRFDSRKVFIEKLNLVSGLEVGFGGVWVGAAPNLLFIPDRDGDDQPDGPAQVVLDGWGSQDTHETLNAFIWGPDGWLYGCHGVFTQSLVGAPGTPKEQRERINAGIWRYHPIKRRFEVFAHGTSNPWGVDFDDHGQAFCTACVIPHLFHVVQGARYHRQAGAHYNAHTYDDIKTIADHVHWLGIQPHGGNNRSDAAGGGHAHSGAMIYLGGSWPAEYRNQVFMNNIHGARINMDRLERHGSGFVGRHGPDFLLANDSWSQILNLRYGAEGQVYMIDWYDQNQCHLPDPKAHDRSNGRIFKVAYKNAQHVRVDLRAKSDAELVELLVHENDWYCRHARRILQERGADRAIHPALEKLAFEHPDETRRLRGLWALHATAGLDGARVRRGLENDSEYVRAWTIQLALEDREVPSWFLAKLTSLAQQDPSPVVRLYLASAAGRMTADQTWPLLDGLAAHSEDRDDHNLPLMYWYALEPLVERAPDRALALAIRSADARLLSFTTRRIAAGDAVAAMPKLVAFLAGVEGASEQLTILESINLALRGRRQVSMPAGWPPLGARLARSPDARVRTHATRLGVTFGDAAAASQMRELLLTRAADTALRQEALAALLGKKDAQLAPTLQKLLDDPQLRPAALRGLAMYDDPATPAAIFVVYAALDLPTRRDALTTLASRSAYAEKLVAAIHEKAIPAGDVTAEVIRQLRSLKNAQIDEQIAAIWGSARETDKDKAKLIADYQKMLAAPSDPPPDATHGRAVYAKVCQQCHRLFDRGGAVGPELTGSHRANLDYLLSNVLDPSALMAKEYMPTIVATTDGRVVTGIVREENTSTVTLLTQNETLILPRDEIEEMAPTTKSMMPDDLLANLAEHDVRSLVAYMGSATQVPMRVNAENAPSFFNGRDLAAWTGDVNCWRIENGEIVGNSSRAEGNFSPVLRSDLLVDDFRLTAEVKLVGEGDHCAILFRGEELHDGTIGAYRVEFGAGRWGRLRHSNGQEIGAMTLVSVDAARWNTVEITAVGSRLRTSINGRLCVDVEDSTGPRHGVIALSIQLENGQEVRFRNLKLDVLTRDKAQGAAASGP